MAPLPRVKILFRETLIKNNFCLPNILKFPTILPWWRRLSASMTCRAVYTGWRYKPPVLLWLPMPETSAVRDQTKCRLTPTRWEILNPNWLCLLVVVSKLSRRMKTPVARA